MWHNSRLSLTGVLRDSHAPAISERIANKGLSAGAYADNCNLERHSSSESLRAFQSIARCTVALGCTSMYRFCARSVRMIGWFSNQHGYTQSVCIQCARCIIGPHRWNIRKMYRKTTRLQRYRERMYIIMKRIVCPSRWKNYTISCFVVWPNV